jgi:hypothetical protein
MSRYELRILAEVVSVQPDSQQWGDLRTFLLNMKSRFVFRPESICDGLTDCRECAFYAATGNGCAIMQLWRCCESSDDHSITGEELALVLKLVAACRSMEISG